MDALLVVTVAWVLGAIALAFLLGSGIRIAERMEHGDAGELEEEEEDALEKV